MTYQVSIFLENKLGHLERVTAVLREAGVAVEDIEIRKPDLEDVFIHLMHEPAPPAAHATEKP